MGEDHMASRDLKPAVSGVREPVKTCGTCIHMGRIYHDGGFEPDHSCAKSDQRRADAQRPTGDFTTDFERAWRTFFDARPAQRACRYYEERPQISDADLELLRSFRHSQYTAATFAEFVFLSPENAACERLCGMYVSRDRGSDYRKVAWRTTPLGRAEIARDNTAKAALGAATARPAERQGQVPGMNKKADQ